MILSNSAIKKKTVQKTVFFFIFDYQIIAFRLKMYLRLLKEGFLFAVNSVVVNKLRTFLSLFGITIGIFSII